MHWLLAASDNRVVVIAIAVLAVGLFGRYSLIRAYRFTDTPRGLLIVCDALSVLGGILLLGCLTSK